MIPVPIDKAYLPYQETGIKWMAARKACLNADDMGLGKTIQALGCINAHPEVSSVLVVCPASVKIHWRRKAAEWVVNPAVEVVVTNYERLTADHLDRAWDLAILDEAHYIKNPKTARAKRCMQINAAARIALTGTPIVNRPIDLFGILCWLRPDLFNRLTKQSFAVRYCDAGMKIIRFWKRGRDRAVLITKSVWDESGASHLDELAYKMSNLMIRRSKAEVLPDLPPVRHQVLDLESTRAAVLHAVTAADLSLDFETQTRDLLDIVKAQWNELSEVRHIMGVEKAHLSLPFLRDCVESSGHIVVFAYHRDVIEILTDGLQEYGAVKIEGDMSERNRQASIDSFQRNPDVRVIVCQLQAGGVGLTLTAASHICFVEWDWSPSTIEQCIARCHRIGQKNSVLVHYLALANSLDARMARLLVKKQSIINQAIVSRKEIAL